MPFFPFVPFAAPAGSVEKLAPGASGISLVEVVGITRFNEMPSCGNAGIRSTLRKIRGTGSFAKTIDIVTARGGRISPELRVEPPRFEGIGFFRKGARLWIAFAPVRDLGKHPHRMVGSWSKNDRSVAGLFEMASAAGDR